MIEKGEIRGKGQERKQEKERAEWEVTSEMIEKGEVGGKSQERNKKKRGRRVGSYHWDERKERSQR